MIVAPVRFPRRISKAIILLFICLMIVVAIDVSIESQSWHFWYGLLHDRMPFLKQFFITVQEFGRFTIAAVAVLLVGFLLPQFRRTIPPFFLALLIANGITESVKIIAGRARPDYGLGMKDKQSRRVSEYLAHHDNPVLRPVPGDYWLWLSRERPGLEFLQIFQGEIDAKKLHQSGDYISFPSGHVASAFVLATWLGLIFPRTRYLWYAIATACALARIFLKDHYPSDVLAAAALGWSSVHFIFSREWAFSWSDRLIGSIDAYIARAKNKAPSL